MSRNAAEDGKEGSRMQCLEMPSYRQLAYGPTGVFDFRTDTWYVTPGVHNDLTCLQKGRLLNFILCLTQLIPGLPSDVVPENCPILFE